MSKRKPNDDDGFVEHDEGAVPDGESLRHVKGGLVRQERFTALQQVGAPLPMPPGAHELQQGLAVIHKAYWALDKAKGEAAIAVSTADFRGVEAGMRAQVTIVGDLKDALNNLQTIEVAQASTALAERTDDAQDALHHLLRGIKKFIETNGITPPQKQAEGTPALVNVQSLLNEVKHAEEALAELKATTKKVQPVLFMRGQIPTGG